MTADELRELFLAYFERHQHTRFKSQSLVPPNDPSLLFSNAGMNQFKERFMGLGDKSLARACSSQKCLRTGDIENVGVTAYHHSFFEMLGNFSFGDYFKEEAIAFAWGFVTDALGMATDRLAVSVYTDDDEAADLWHDKIGVPTDRIVRFGEKDNFWPASAPSQGPNGPCGPCSEIYYDRGETYACGKPGCGIDCNCPRWVEIWNLVFMQYERQEGGKLVPLPRKNIDTGMGLERTLAVINGKISNFETELFVPILNAISDVGNIDYKPDHADGARVRRIADHTRAAIFCIHDGVAPGNEGRDYVVRKLMRRAIADGRRLGIEGTFLHKLVPTITRLMATPYPELGHDAGRITTILRNEEEQFGTTLDQGLDRVEQMIEERKQEGTMLTGADAFKLYDTFGVPVETTITVITAQEDTFDRAEFDEAFHAEMHKQREKSRAGSKIDTDVFRSNAVAHIRGSVPATEFAGYDATESDGTVLAILQGSEVVDSADAGSSVTLVLDRTPFYAESGGQVADTGTITATGLMIEVADVVKDGDYFLHRCEIAEGTVSKGMSVQLSVDADLRLAIMRNHTATHIMHAALRTILGTHVQQAGSAVDAQRLRFDFTHAGALTDDEVAQIERYVNERIIANAPVASEQTTLDAAKQQGAMALFSEKYGDSVRLVHVGDFSHELCGGTHMTMTGGIGPFVVTQETSVAAGTRRIEAVTGTEALGKLARDTRVLLDTCRTLKTTPTELGTRVEKLLGDVKTLKRAKPQSGATLGIDITALLNGAEEVDGVRIVATRLPDGATPQELRTAADLIRRKAKTGTALFLASNAGKSVALIAAVTPDLVARGLHAGNLIKQVAPIIGGGGGGRADLAQAGGKDAARIDDAVIAARQTFRDALS